jgi:tRNA dimethylallyltransferase
MAANKIPRKLLAIVGPTASGKTKLGVLLAERLRAEIVSADSRQVYKYLDIGTAKPDAAELRRVRHHFIDILEPDQEYNAGEYGLQARQCIEELFAKGIQPVLVGGSGLYIRSVIDGLFDGPQRDSAIRSKLEQEVEQNGAEAMFTRLQKIDPAAASTMDKTKLHRMIRALEVYEVTGMPISEQHALQNSSAPFEVLQIGLDWDRKLLYARIDRRVDAMIAMGLIEEAKQITAKGFLSGLQALNTVGYKEVYDFLAANIEENKMIELIKRNTRRFAKRQLTWFRADKRILWQHVDEEMNWTILADTIVRQFQSRENSVHG